MDIDHFKEINDTFGHEAGDLVQKHVANILKKQSRTNDLIFRYGGDEFLVLLPSTSSLTAYQYSQRLRKQFEDTSVDYNGEKITVTMSIGIAAFITGKEKPEQVLIDADAALYQAKADGRNCVIISETCAG
jgi:diguanylate cyclase (GGDEF)-like protein